MSKTKKTITVILPPGFFLSRYNKDILTKLLGEIGMEKGYEFTVEFSNEPI